MKWKDMQLSVLIVISVPALSALLPSIIPTIRRRSTQQSGSRTLSVRWE